MKYFNLYRVSAYLMIFFFAAHTFGGMLSGKSRGSEADDVISSMKSVHFDVQGMSCTYYDFYFGFGILFSVFLVFTTVVAWHLGGLDGKGRAALSPIAWALFGSFVLTALMSWVYFFIAPGVTATLIAVLLGLACVKKSW